MPDEPILRVAVPAPLYTFFDYLPPAGCDSPNLKPGVRLRVPFGRGDRCGVLFAVVSESTFERKRLKRATKLLDEVPLFSADDLDLLQWVAVYYQHPIGEVVANALPVRLRKGEPQVGMTHRVWRLTSDGQAQSPDSLARAPKQALLLVLLADAPQGLTQEMITCEAGECRSVLTRMESKGWVASSEELLEAVVERVTEAAPQLHSEQHSAVDAVVEAGDEFAVHLLDGVTGSGKTEVYLSLIKVCLEQERQALVLVPEIGLTPQLMRRFERRIGGGLVVLHSGLAAGERERAWHEARLGRARVILGTRSALFTPLPRLGLILVDEEHDLSFKQQDGFRYSARDIAVIRGQRANCPVVLGSATPSLESLHNARSGRYQHLRLTRRAGEAKPPRLDLLDIRSVRLQAGVSPVLMRMMKEELAVGNQVLLFLNRRGYAPVLTCHDCGWVAQCRRCDARMTLHATSGILWCHHCGSQKRLPHRCPECNGDDLRPLGQGTERLEELLVQQLPEVAIVRIDRDTTRRKGSLEKLLQEIKEGKHSLLLGTQMLAKGHHFPDVTLVGILDVDQGLFSADYRAAERMAQLIVQVAGRAGRAEKPGRVVVQTRHPDHPLMQLLVREGYGAFAVEALAERKETQFPPFSYQALLRAEGPKEGTPREFLDEAAALAGELAQQDIELWGPVPAPMERRAGRFRAHLLIQSSRRGVLQKLLSQWIPQLSKLKSSRRVRWSIDVDPQEMF
ncbi:MAG: primosomal protein N' [Candidatus Sedimenticola sp. (ex Thyasira tokunagai)]